jgi:hypothetical protein
VSRCESLTATRAIRRDQNPGGNGKPARAWVNLECVVEAEAGREHRALRAQSEHALGQLDRQVVTDAVGEERELQVLEEKHFLVRRALRGGGRGRGSAELENDP